VDTNCDPDEADYVIPGNDDAIRSCALITKLIADSIADGQQKVSSRDFQRQQPQENGAGPAEERVAQSVEVETGEPEEVPVPSGRVVQEEGAGAADASAANVEPSE
jgi:small subunit ribosomal protein S2